jgi:Bacterial Ig domain
VSLDDIIYKLIADEYVIRVERDGLLTYANSDATFTITNIPPNAKDQSYSTEYKAIEITLKATDPDKDNESKLTYIKVSDPSNGTLSNIESITGRVTYTPKTDYV